MDHLESSIVPVFDFDLQTEIIGFWKFQAQLHQKIRRKIFKIQQIQFKGLLFYVNLDQFSRAYCYNLYFQDFNMQNLPHPGPLNYFISCNTVSWCYLPSIDEWRLLEYGILNSEYLCNFDYSQIYLMNGNYFNFLLKTCKLVNKMNYTTIISFKVIWINNLKDIEELNAWIVCTLEKIITFEVTNTPLHCSKRSIS